MNSASSIPVSVIIVNYNSGRHVSSCVRSVLQHAPDSEVIVVDNASQDDSITLLDTEFADQSQLKIIRHPVNAGFAVACNLGTSHATHEYYFYLNPDCIIDENTIPRLLACLNKHENVGMVGGLLLNADGSEQRGGRRSVPTPGRTLVRILKLSFLSKRFPRLFPDFNLHQQALPEHPIEVDAISGACMLVKRQAFDEVSGLDEAYFLHCEDLDWCMRFHQQGWKIMFVPDAILTHEQGACSKSTPIAVEWYKHNGMVRFYRKFFRHEYPHLLLWTVILAIWVRFGSIAALSSVKNVWQAALGSRNLK
ncbi:N-acetylglucosaminyl-diphospho-decaprenol L-rhamnosyltransferase [Gimesia panareensis]|uniref:N-acetylglucosaminyl-diphospho-decaprenol L-rhamnosyltransferase n=1 Tax=Gimesia panareensis TaxID=2527978 RepID=A0A517QC69_9PLAN|nr:glycosyltransferase family 2 protein [Gimesia panareensis]QDT29224.1 N-acetylglucosaminyl-diphospho-decaprenol L-rhamnosyltransferase [Gimesia panareensis]